MAARTLSEFGLDLFDHEAIARPHQFYARLRREAPIAWSDQLRGWVLTRYEDVRAVLRNHEQWSSVRGDGARLGRRDMAIEEVAPPGTLTMLGADRPDHTRLRKLLSLDFTPNKIGRMLPRIETITRQLLAGAAEKPAFDVAEELAVPLPVTVIAELLGIPPELGPQFKRWSDAATEPVAPNATSEDVAARNTEIVAFREYLEARIAERRTKPTDDFIGRLVTAHEDEDKLSDAELLGAVNLLLLAGNETTTNLISNAVLALTRFPDQQRALRQRPELIDAAVEEFLRYDGSVQFTTRKAMHPTEIGGQHIEAGDSVILALASANRDEAVFDSPDTLNFFRSGNKHLGFGDWIHICLGQFLARMETSVAIRELLIEFPEFELAGPEAEVVYRPNFNLRGPKHLPIRGAC